MKRQFAKNVSSNWAVYLSAALISFFLTPYIITKVGQAAFGVWILVGSFSGYLGLFDFGIGFAVVRFVARYQKTGEPDKRNEIVATAFYTAIILASLVLAATIYIMYNAADIFNIPIELISQSQMVIFLIGISITLGFPLSIFSEALAGGLWRFDLFNKVSLLMGLIRTGLTILFLELGWGLAGLGLAALIGSLLGYIWRTKMLFSLLPDLSIRPGLVKRRVIKKIGGYSFFSFMLVLSGRIAYYSDSFIVGIYRGVEDVAIFGIAVKLTEYLRQLIFTITKQFTPVASRYDPSVDQASLRRIFYDGSRLNLLFSLPISLILFFWGGRMIALWVGDSFAESEIILQVLLLGHILSFVQGIGGEVLLGVGRHKLFSILSMLAAAVNILLSIFLIKPLGLVGVAWGTTIPLALLSILYLPFATLRLVGGSIGEFLRSSVLPAMMASLLPGIIIIYAVDYLYDLMSLGLSLIAVILSYAISGYYWGLTGIEREKVLSGLRRIPRLFQ
jgi:O-antigen/teichoic acid export membrane protein